MKILVTGGAGFIGSHVVDAYLADGHEVTVLDNLSAGVRENLSSKARFCQLDVCSPEAAEVIREFCPDIINHHAAQIDVRKSIANPRQDLMINVGGFIHILEAAKEVGVHKVIFASTGGAIYGEQDAFPATESHPTRPLSPYGLNKLTAEHYLAYYGTLHRVPSVVLRYSNVYGPRQNADGDAGVVSIFLRRMLRGETPCIYGDGRQTRDYVYVSDVVEANRLATKDGVRGVYNVGTGRETDVLTVFQLLRSFCGVPCEKEHRPERKGEQRRSVISPEKIRRELGWRDNISVEEGMKKTALWFLGAMRGDH